MNIYTKPSHPHFRGVPSWFRYLCADAVMRRNGVSYLNAGIELARHSGDMIEDGEEPGEEADVRFEKLWDRLRAGDDDGVLRWFDREFPRCLDLVPDRRRGKFLEGVLFAVEEGII